MRTFFDGVPPAGAPAQAAKLSETKKTALPKKKTESAQSPQPTVYFHNPYLEKQCDNCHDTKSSQKLMSEQKELCFVCHEDFLKNKKVIHYPLTEGACTECHDPHQSSNKRLLKKPILEICFSCHDEKDVRSNPAHEGQNVCTECHNAHASNEEKLLK